MSKTLSLKRLIPMSSKKLRIPAKFIFRIALGVFAIGQVGWIFLDLYHLTHDTSEQSKISIRHANHSDVFSLDRFGRPISREEVQISKRHYIRGKKYFMTIGIATIERIKDGKRYSYLSRTLNSLISKMPTAAKMEVVIVILCANRDSNANERTYKELQKTFHELIVKGFLQVIVAPERFYRSLENLPKTLNDSSLRMKWRSKQSLDYAFLLYYCHGLGEYHLQIEDDVDIEAGYYEKLKSDIATTKAPWAIYQYYKMGFIGKLFKSQYLQLFANIFRIYYFEMPLDLLYFQPFILSNLKNRQIIANKFLFHHIGKQSSSQNADIY